MNKPKISVIIPVYNKEEFLEETLSSLEHQTLKDIEILCIDDESTDNSLDILEKYADKDSRFKIFTQKNSGPGIARNKGISEASGEYVFFLDADDWIEKDALEQLYKQAIKNNSDLVLFNSIEHYSDGHLRNRIYRVSDDITDYDDFTFNYLLNKKLVMNSYLVVHTKLHRLNFIKENNLSFNNHLFEDVFFHIKSMIMAETISYNRSFLHHYRRSDNSRQNKSIQSRESFVIFDIFTQVKNFLEENNLMYEFKLNFIEFNLTEVRNIYKNLDNNLKNELYSIAKDYFNNIEMKDSYLRQLSKNSKLFYNSLINSNNATEFNIITTLNYKNYNLIDEKDLDNVLKLIEYYDDNDTNILTIKSLIRSNKKAYGQINRLNHINNLFESSTSWKITKPLRTIISKIKKYLKNRRISNVKKNELKQLTKENDIFYGLFNSSINSNKISYEELLQNINKYDNKIFKNNSSITINDLVNENIYFNTRDNKKIASKYENIVFKEIINDILKDKTTIEAFNKIIEYNLFDENYYKKEYDYSLSIHPLLHYIYIGYLENKSPNKYFDGNFYRKFNKNAGVSKLNPLVYLVLYGFDEGLVKINKNAWQPLTINRKKIDKKILNFNELGINSTKRDKKIIVSLTTYKTRINHVKYTIYSLLNQTVKADEIILWLPNDEFLDNESNIPEEILNLRKNGLTIKICENIKSYKKLIPALKEYPNDLIITADDDIYYPKDWIETLYLQHKKHPDNIITHRAKKITLNNGEINSYNKWHIIESMQKASYTNFFTTGGGTLFVPSFLDNTVFNEKLFKKLTPYSDDIWFWAMAVLNKTKIEVPPDNMYRLIYTKPERDVLNNKDTLWYSNEKENDRQLANIFNEFPEIKERIYDCLKNEKV